MQKSNPAMQECITDCRACQDECASMLFNHCLAEGGDHVEQKHVKLMTDCIAICEQAADFMVRQSPMHAFICEACAKICDACADSCEALGDAHMKKCADICRRCAESCRKMGQAARKAA
jgi:hypothetical protein